MTPADVRDAAARLCDEAAARQRAPVAPGAGWGAIARSEHRGNEASALAAAIRALPVADDAAGEVERLRADLEYERGTIAYHVEAAEGWLRELHRIADALGARERRSDPLPDGDALVVRVVALRAQADAPRIATDAAERAARGAAWELAELRATVAMLRPIAARVVDAEAEAAWRTDEVVAIGEALGRPGATGAECVAAIRALATGGEGR